MIEFFFEIIFEIIGECFSSFIKNRRIHIWIRLFVLSLFWIPLIGLMFFVTYRMYQDTSQVHLLIILGILDIILIVSWLKTMIGIMRRS